MKIAILGAAGVRSPLLIEAIGRRQERLGLRELALMDIDGERLELIGALSAPLEQAGLPLRVIRTTDARAALAGADFVITTFRVGSIESRVVDEQVPLRHGMLGQETTGPGGFAMAMRTIPVLLDYLKLMREVCPQAWLVNFANPAGMLAEVAATVGGWPRAVGICDAPPSIQRVAAAVLAVPPEQLYLDYVGLNHLGWVRSVLHNGRDVLPQLIAMLSGVGNVPGLPFSAEFITGLGMIPNEYLYYYYEPRRSVENILRSGQSRALQIVELNRRLFAELRRLYAQGDIPAMQAAYRAYGEERSGTYMARETGQSHDLHSLDARLATAVDAGGYAGVALDLIEGLAGAAPRLMILNLPNRGAIPEMADDDVVEAPAFVSYGMVRPLACGAVAAHCLGLMKQVKAYEKLTIAAAVEGSYSKAVQALALHPLVPGYDTARTILDEYRRQHGVLFPALA